VKNPKPRLQILNLVPNLVLSCIGLVCFNGIFVGQAIAQSAATADQRLDYDIKYLASDELEGREPGSEGIEKAAQYIIETWKEFGVAPGGNDGTYRQDFTVSMGTVVDKEKSGLNFSGAVDIPAEMGVHYQPVMLGGSGEFNDADLVFVGYGINADENNYNDFKDADCQGKVVVAIRMEPQQKDPNSVFEGTENSAHASIARKLNNAKEAGAVGFILVNDGARDADELAQADLFGPSDDIIPFLHMKRDVLDIILAKAPIVTATGKKLNKIDDVEAMIDETLEPMTQTLDGVKVSGGSTFTNDGVTTSNVVGIIKGEGPNADEVIVIGGHYDHLGYGGYGSNAPGRREVHNGADDNATGTAGLVELARRFAQDEKKPSRTLVFIAFSGEERGLLGSAYYVNNPIYDLEKTVTMINYDMIGRLRNDKLTIFGAGTGDSYDKILDASNDPMDPLELNKVASASAGSDHMAFVRKEIPVMFLHTGLTDIYHTPEDDYETLNIEGANRVVDFTERLIRGLANAETRPKYVSVGGNRRGRRPSYLGVRLDYEADDRGPKVEEAPDEAPAAEAGLQAGDVILTIGGEEVADASELSALLIKNRPGSEVEVVFMRGGEEKTVTVTLARTPRRRARAQQQEDKGNEVEKSEETEKGDG